LGCVDERIRLKKKLQTFDDGFVDPIREVLEASVRRPQVNKL
jgi:hypothetical protein